MNWFGPRKDEVWRQLSNDLHGEFIEGGFLKGSRVQAHVGPWTITLDTTSAKQDGESPATRLRAPFVNPSGFRFQIYRKGLFSGLEKLLGMQDIEVGDPEFDEAFVIRGNDENQVRALFSRPRIRELIAAQPKILLEVKDHEGWFGPHFPEDVDKLEFQSIGVIKDLDQLKGLYELFAEVLDQLCRIGSSSKMVPDVEL